MSVREEIQKRISKMDDAILPELLKELDRLEKRKQGRKRFSEEFLTTLHQVRTRNTPENPNVMLEDISDAVQTDRQRQK
jgi:hypothetical protein